MEFELKNVDLKAGDQLKVKGQILHDADRFSINLGRDENNLALHFNPRFFDEEDGSVIVCNSRLEGCWREEERKYNPLERGSEVKIVMKMAGDMFTVELPDGVEVQFPNYDVMDSISYVSISGDFRIKSFKIC